MVPRTARKRSDHGGRDDRRRGGQRLCGADPTQEARNHHADHSHPGHPAGHAGNGVNYKARRLDGVARRGLPFLTLPLRAGASRYIDILCLPVTSYGGLRRELDSDLDLLFVETDGDYLEVPVARVFPDRLDLYAERKLVDIGKRLVSDDPDP